MCGVCVCGFAWCMDSWLDKTGPGPRAPGCVQAVPAPSPSYHMDQAWRTLAKTSLGSHTVTRSQLRAACGVSTLGALAGRPFQLLFQMPPLGGLRIKPPRVTFRFPPAPKRAGQEWGPQAGGTPGSRESPPFPRACLCDVSVPANPPAISQDHLEGHRGKVWEPPSADPLGEPAAPAPPPVGELGGREHERRDVRLSPVLPVFGHATQPETGAPP